MKDTRRELLKQLLQGGVNLDEVVEQLVKLDPLAEVIPVFSYADEPGVYKVGDVTGLSEDEMKEATRGKNIFKVRIHRCGPPIAHCERDVVM